MSGLMPDLRTAAVDALAHDQFEHRRDSLAADSDSPELTSGH